MLLVIFGAGASFDSVPHLRPRVQPDIEDDRPPLANELFGNRKEFVTAMQIFKECIPLIPQLRKQGVAVEQELARIQEQAKTFPRANQELMAIRFYLQYALWHCQKRWSHRHNGINNYATLLREIERWRFEFKEHVCFVTFNYDTMLEQAMLQGLGFNIPGLASYTSQTNYSLIKLHGSVTWGLGLAGIESPETYGYQRIIREAANLPITDGYVLV